MNERIERVLGIVNPERRTAIKKLLVIGFAVPTIASYPVKDLAFATVGSPGTTTVVTTTTVITTTTFVTTTPLTTLFTTTTL